MPNFQLSVPGLVSLGHQYFQRLIGTYPPTEHTQPTIPAATQVSQEPLKSSKSRFSVSDGSVNEMPSRIPQPQLPFTQKYLTPALIRSLMLPSGILLGEGMLNAIGTGQISPNIFDLDPMRVAKLFAMIAPTVQLDFGYNGFIRAHKRLPTNKHYFLSDGIEGLSQRNRKRFNTRIGSLQASLANHASQLASEAISLSAFTLSGQRLPIPLTYLLGQVSDIKDHLAKSPSPIIKGLSKILPSTWGDVINLTTVYPLASVAWFGIYYFFGDPATDGLAAAFFLSTFFSVLTYALCFNNGSKINHKALLLDSAGFFINLSWGFLDGDMISTSQRLALYGALRLGILTAQAYYVGQSKTIPKNNSTP